MKHIRSTAHTHPFMKEFNVYIPSIPMSPLISSFKFSDQNYVCMLLCEPHPRISSPYFIKRVQIIKLNIALLQIPITFSLVGPFHPLMQDEAAHPHIQKRRQNFGSACFHLCIFKYVYMYPSIVMHTTIHIRQLRGKFQLITSHHQAYSFKNHSVKSITAFMNLISSFTKYTPLEYI